MIKNIIHNNEGLLYSRPSVKRLFVFFVKRSCSYPLFLTKIRKTTFMIQRIVLQFQLNIYELGLKDDTDVWYTSRQYLNEPIEMHIGANKMDYTCHHNFPNFPNSFIWGILPYFGKRKASDIPSKSGLLLFSYFTQTVCSSSRSNIMHNHHPAERYVR